MWYLTGTCHVPVCVLHFLCCHWSWNALEGSISEIFVVVSLVNSWPLVFRQSLGWVVVQKALSGKMAEQAVSCVQTQSRSGKDCSAPGRWERLAHSKACENRESSLLHTLFVIKAWHWREWGVKQGLHPCWCGLQGCLTSELPGKQSTAKLRTVPGAAEVACIRDHSQRRGSAEISKCTGWPSPVKSASPSWGQFSCLKSTASQGDSGINC